MVVGASYAVPRHLRNPRRLILGYPGLNSYKVRANRIRKILKVDLDALDLCGVIAKRG
jgi:hypothetical protein